MPSKVVLTAETAKDLLLKHYGFTATKIREIIGYDDQNFIVSGKLKGQHNQYVFKVINDSEANRTVCQEVSSILANLHVTDLQIPKPVKTITNDFLHPIAYNGTETKGRLLLHLLSFVPGMTLADVKHSTQSQLNSLAFETGIAIAKLDTALLTFHMHKDLKRSDYRWNMANAKFCRTCIDYVDDKELKQTFMKINESFDQKVLDNIDVLKLRRGLIHGDANSGNIIINERIDDKTLSKCKFKVTGVIDFNDMMNTEIVFEAATMMAYMMTKAWQDGHDPLEVAANALYGFEKVLPLNEDEKNVLYISIMKRLAVSNCSGWLEKSLGAPPEKLEDMAATGSLAEQLWNENEDEILHKIYSIRET